MSNEPSIADLKSAFAVHLSTLPPPAEGRHEYYRPRTRDRTLATAGAGLATAVTLASVAVALAGRDHEVPDLATEPPATATLSTVDIAGASVVLPAGVRPAEADGCLPEIEWEGDSSTPPIDIAGWGTVMWSEDGSPIDCFLEQSDSGAMSPPADAEPTTLAGLDAWTWRIDNPWGVEDAHVYFVEVPRGGDRPAVPLLVIVAGSAAMDVSEIVEDVANQL